jgi:acetyl-CoA carboxylase carboxyltransferase component
LAQIEASSLKKSGEIVDEAKALFDNKSQIRRTGFALLCCFQIVDDAIIDPLDTRTWISMGIEAANSLLRKI